MPPLPSIASINRSSKCHVPFLAGIVSPYDQFKHNIVNFIKFALMTTPEQKEAMDKTYEIVDGRTKEVVLARDGKVLSGEEKGRGYTGLKKIAPYWYPYTTMTKMRWIGRELLEVVSTEFRDRSMEYYRYALESGVTTVNGKVASPTTILRDGDRIENVVHRHEPPVTNTPVKILHHDVEREFVVVDKPGSIPVHASGRYFRNTLTEILVSEFGFTKPYPANRLDRLTSGLMIIPLSPERARLLTAEFTAGTVKKEYVARVKGRFPSHEVVCEEPLLTVDRQMGLNIVHPEGKYAKTVFNLIRYDENTDSSVVRCEPQTGRSHQIRVHLQFLGHPIANDPVYSSKRIWGPSEGKGGIDMSPSAERTAPEAPDHLKGLASIHNPERLNWREGMKGAQAPTDEGGKPKLLPRETGEDIGMGSPVPLSAEAVRIITRLRNQKDEDEDWGRWRDVVFKAKGALNPRNLVVSPPPLQNRRVRGNKATLLQKPKKAERAPGDAVVVVEEEISSKETASPSPSTSSSTSPSTSVSTAPTTPLDSSISPPCHTPSEIISKIASMEPAVDINTVIQSDNYYCPECYLPLHPDPKPEKLYIFLHARKYTTSLGAYETAMPEWAEEGWTWDREE